MSKLRLAVLIFSCLLSFIIYTATSQNKPSIDKHLKDTILHKFVYTFTDVMPSPEGGLQNLFKQLSKKLKYLPGDVDYAGKVIVAFVIEPNGKIDGERVIRDPSGSKRIFCKQIFEVVKTIKWKPGTLNGKAVPVLYKLPVVIDLSE
ncbi:MAG: energy transducer TonB [Mucilaginibacter sp.]